MQVATVILAGGQGTRLYPLTTHHSKPALSFAGRYRLIDIPISNSIHAGFTQIFIVAQYLSNELQHHIGQTYHFGSLQKGSIDFLTPQETEKTKEWFNGTADAIRKTLPMLLQSEANYFLILSGDHLYNIDLQKMIEKAVDLDTDLTIAATLVDESLAGRCGLLQIDDQGIAKAFAEKPNDDERKPFCKKGNRYLASMGMYVFKREALIQLVKSDDREDFGKHLIQTAIKKWKTGAFIYDGYWEDIGTIPSYFQANLRLASHLQTIDLYNEKKPIFTRPSFLPGPKITSTTEIIESILSEGCWIEAKKIERSILGVRSIVGKGSVVKESLLLGNPLDLPPSHNQPLSQNSYSIGENCLIERAIIDENVTIQNNVRLVNRSNRMEYDGEGVFIRDGIIVVTRGAYIQEGFEL